MLCRSSLPLVVLLAFGCAPTEQNGMDTAEPAALSAEDSAAINASFERLKPAGRANDWNAWMAEYAADPVRMPPNNPALRGHQANLEWLNTFPRITAFDFTVELLEGRGDLAVAHGSYTLSTVAQGDMPAMDEDGKFMTVLKKQPDGSWKFVRDMWNSNRPMPGM